MLTQSLRAAIEIHISYLDRLLIKNFREIRRVRLAKKAGAQRLLKEMLSEVDYITDMQLRLRSYVASGIFPESSLE